MKRWNTTLVVCDTPLVKEGQAGPLAPDIVTRSVLSAAEDLRIPTVHLLVLGVQAPTVVPQTVTKIQHIAPNNNTATAGNDDDQLYTAIEDAIAGDAPCTHILMASKGDGEPTEILTKANKRFVSCLVPDVVAIESRDTFLVGDDKVRKQKKDMLKLLSIRAEAFLPAPLSEKEVVIEVVRPRSKSSSLAFKIVPIAVVGLVLLCFL